MLRRNNTAEVFFEPVPFRELFGHPGGCDSPCFWWLWPTRKSRREDSRRWGTTARIPWRATDGGPTEWQGPRAGAPAQFHVAMATHRSHRAPMTVGRGGTAKCAVPLRDYDDIHVAQRYRVQDSVLCTEAAVSIAGCERANAAWEGLSRHPTNIRQRREFLD